ncbi:MAG TPA: LLM class flavin-dependent oxidoreductase [Candidatus Dormibacteraeota bacterium]|nr:LLM class flavin-dependent oxidoreductase [Candidatus Dormibacteraeota bacterium]
MLQVAVKLPPTIGDVGEYLADVTALEAAGAHTIWVDDSALEPWIVLGAMSAVTHRIGLGCLLTSMGQWPTKRLSACVSTLQKLSRGRIVVGLAPRDRQATDVAVLQAAGARVFTTGSHEKPAEGVIFNVESADQLSDGRGQDVEVWAGIAIPPDREAWARTLGSYEEAGATGVIVSWNARVLDLLRNPEADDRSDLLISTG